MSGKEYIHITPQHGGRGTIYAHSFSGRVKTQAWVIVLRQLSCPGEGTGIFFAGAGAPAGVRGNDFWTFGNGNGSVHSQLLGKGTGMKIPFQFLGTGTGMKIQFPI